MPLRLETERLVLTPETVQDAGWSAELLTARGGPACPPLPRRGSGSALVLRTRTDGRALGYCALILGRASLEEPKIVYELLPRARSGVRDRGEPSAGRGGVRDQPHPPVVNVAVGERAVPAGPRGARLPPDHSTTDDDGELVWMVRDR